ncbi:MAG: sel1 repeat family protein [Magnetococcales bacterium]|nr:sel1 repeat family protein [Magnetococcales bacterium]
MILIGLCLFSTPLLAADVERLLRLSRQDDIHAQSRLGQLYFDGHEVKQDYQAAMHWWRLAADRGDAHAQNSVGTLYDNGKGVPRDYREAAKWFLLAANQGHVMARRNLGWMYEKGQGFKKDLVQSYMWQYLAEQGRRKGQGTNPSGMIPCRLCEPLAKRMTPEQVRQAREMAQRWQPSRNDRNNSPHD